MSNGQLWQRAQGTLGQLEIWSLAGATTSERQVLYAATVGGMTGNNPAPEMNLANSAGTLVEAGVYRQTMLLRGKHLFLPAIFR